jgi:hypothetical protein
MAYDTVLFLHLLALCCLVGAFTTVVGSYIRLRGADSIAEAAELARLANRASVAFPVAVLALVATGAYLATERWAWSNPWIVVSIAALILDTVQGPLVAGPRARALREALDAAGAGSSHEAHARALANDRVLWVVLLANPGIALAITWNMTVKPGAAGAVAAVLIGYGAGAAIALLGVTRSSRVDAVTSP